MARQYCKGRPSETAAGVCPDNFAKGGREKWSFLDVFCFQSSRHHLNSPQECVLVWRGQLGKCDKKMERLVVHQPKPAQRLLPKTNRIRGHKLGIICCCPYCQCIRCKRRRETLREIEKEGKGKRRKERKKERKRGNKKQHPDNF